MASPLNPGKRDRCTRPRLPSARADQAIRDYALYTAVLGGVPRADAERLYDAMMAHKEKDAA